METIVAICHPKKKPDISFHVIYWVNSDYSEFRDSYLQTYLQEDAKMKIIEIAQKYDISLSDCITVLHEETPYSKSVKLYEFYKQNKRPLSWEDKNCDQKLSYIRLRIVNESIDDEVCKQIVSEIKSIGISALDFEVVNDVKNTVLYEESEI